MKMLKAAAAVAALTMGTSAASAQVVVEANGARTEGRWGGEIGIGYRIAVGGFAITPAAGAFLLEGDNDRYYRDQFSNGQSRCRDGTNGEFADDANCVNIAARAYGRVEASYTIAGAIEIGAGVRISDEVRPYGMVAVPLGANFALRGMAGQEYVALGVRARF